MLIIIISLPGGPGLKVRLGRTSTLRGSSRALKVDRDRTSTWLHDMRRCHERATLDDGKASTQDGDVVRGATTQSSYASVAHQCGDPYGGTNPVHRLTRDPRLTIERVARQIGAEQTLDGGEVLPR